MSRERRTGVAPGRQTKQRRVEQPVRRNREHTVPANIREAKAEAHGSHGDYCLEIRWLDHGHIAPGNALFHSQQAARIQAVLRACQRLSTKLRPQLLFSRATVKRRDSSGHHVHINAPMCGPEGGTL